MSAPAVFLDRDGTIIEEVGYLSRVDDIRLIPGAGEALRLLRAHGFRLVLATNQSGVAQGLFGEADVAAVHDALAARLADEGVRFDAIYYCPHHPEATIDAYRQVCDCRKPATGMARRAARELGVVLERSYAIGDRWRDLLMATGAGAIGILVRTGYGRHEELTPPPEGLPAFVADDVLEAARWIVAREMERKG